MPSATRDTRITGPAAKSWTALSLWRRIAASLVAFSLLAFLTISLAGAAGAKERSAAAEQPKVYPASGQGTALAHGVVDMAKLPLLQPHAVIGVQPPLVPAPDTLTAQQRQSYNDRVRKSAPATVAGAQQGGTAPGVSPKFVGGGKVPYLVKSFDGLNSTQAGGGTGNAAIATDLSYLMEGVDNAIAIYRASNGTLAFGPYAPDSFFAPVKRAGDTFGYPQLYYDTMRDRWIVVYLEIAPSHTVTYLDVAISKTTSPTQPSPGAQYNVYQFGTNFAPDKQGVNSYCDYETLGVEYWGVYLTCVNYRLGSFVGNTVLAINKAPMLSGANPNMWYWNDAVKIANDAGPALLLSPATEEGVQDAEFIVATDAGYGTTSQNLTACALTNLRNIDSAQPAMSCMHQPLNLSYADPLPARQPGGATINVGYGTKQVYYKAGRLFLAWTAYTPALSDYIYLVEVRPVLSRIQYPAPVVIVDVDVTQIDFWASFQQDVYTPGIIGTDEDDIVLVHNVSGPSVYPGVGYTGRKASDQFDSMGQDGAGVQVAFGTHATTAYWGKYAGCAISLNSVTRGGIWCVGEYTGSVADPGWNTRLVNLRAE